MLDTGCWMLDEGYEMLDEVMSDDSYNYELSPIGIHSIFIHHYFVIYVEQLLFGHPASSTWYPVSSIQH